MSCKLETTAYYTALSSAFDIVASTLHVFLFQQMSGAVNYRLGLVFTSLGLSCHILGLPNTLVFYLGLGHILSLYLACAPNLQVPTKASTDLQGNSQSICLP